jgi:hypothetical protein
VCIDGGAIVATGTNVNAFSSIARIGLGMAPWGTSDANTCSNQVHRAALYAPVTVSDAVLQQLTAP